MLTGDNTKPYETEEETKKLINALMNIFESRNIPVAVTFGNHDSEQGAMSRDDLMEYYNTFSCSVSVDDGETLSGCGTYNIPVLSSNGEKLKFNLWVFDSGDYDEEGRYSCVKPDQIEWYKETSEALEAQEGKKVPSMVFQHMIVQEIWDEMFFKVPFYVDTLTEKYGDTIYFFGPDTSVLNGFLFEPPSPGYYNHGEFDAMVERGDVLAILVGHDHYNTYDVESEGIRLINTPGASFNAYGTEFTRGSRLITLHEDDPENFDTEVITVNDAAILDKAFAESVGTTPFEAALWKGLGYILLALSEFSGIFASLVFWD